ncbi:MAG TPA: TonB-dependent receptor, partial [Polyangia bacterium]|nr:TonB-dependent receptor [Polyangia bacterium]
MRRRARWGKWLSAGALLALPRAALAEQTAPAAPVPIQMPEVVVRGRPDESPAAAPVTASQGTVEGDDLQDLPLLRRGELMEAVPGMVVTQHSGDGKANQYFLRGFNLDHGTDFAFSVDGVPVNLPSHAHGQGYSDLNFLIPELVAGIDFKKGPFYPEVGDFSGAGAADVRLVDRLPEGLATAQLGRFGYARVLVADSPRLGPGRLLAAFSYDHADGPWVLPEHANRYNGLVRYRWDRGPDALTATASLYAAPDWRATDQVPGRALADGTLPRFGAVDPTDGGDAGRAGLSLDWTRRTDGATTRLLVYTFAQRLNLYSNFTYFLDDPVNGDQFQQIDRRWVAGAQASRRWTSSWWGHAVENTAGLQLRGDDIPTSALNHTASRHLLAVRIDDRVHEGSAGVYVANQVQWTPWLRSQLGLRADLAAADVDSDTAANSGRDAAGILSPKVGLTFGPWRDTQLYANVGAGFHSNDARGVTISVDPVTQQAQQ